MRQLSVFLLSILLIQGLSQISLFSQIPNSEDYVVTHFGMEDGLPQNSINAIEQSNDGYIWIATFSGLVRFDGKNFKTFNLINTPCLISDEFYDLFISSDNSIWLLPSTMNTIVTRFKDGKCKSFKIADGIQGPLNFIESNDGSMWINTFDKSFKFNGDDLESVLPTAEGEIIKSALNSSDGSWYSLNKNLYRIFNGSPVLVYNNIPNESSAHSYVRNHPTKDRTILVGTQNKIIEYEHEGNLTQKEIYLLPYNHFLDLEVDDFNNQYAITAEGIAVKEENNFVPFEPFGKQSNIRIKSILHDNEGNYWIGTDGDGLFRFRKKFISMIDKKVGLDNEKMLSITRIDNGKMLFSTNCTGIYEWENGQATLSKVHDYLPIGCYWSVFQDSRGRMWFGSGEPFMANGYGKPVTKFGLEQGFDGYAVFVITEHSNGYIWVASSQGIYIYDGTKLIRKVTEADGLYYSDSRVMFEDDDGTMWVGTNGGLHTIKDYKVSRIPLVDESGSEFMDQPNIRTIHKDIDGIYWIGTYGDGLFRIKNEEVFRFTTEQGLFDNTSSHIIEDDEGNFWMGSNRGIHRVSRENLNKVADGEQDEIVSYSYGSVDGMNSPETNGGFQPSYIVEENGDFLLPTVAGVAKVSIKEVEVNKVPPPIYIESVRTSEGELKENKNIQLSHNEAFLEIQYSAINFTNPDKVKFRYRLEGLNDNWIEVGNRREALYSKIPPGEYKFRVIASNNDGFWNDEGASLDVIVTPPFWNTAWFYSIICLLVIGGVGLFYYRRVENLKEENEKQKKFSEQLIESQEQERRRIASELHDGLGQQILVIKNRLELAKKKSGNKTELEGELDEIMQSAVISISEVRSISHGLRPVHLEKFGLTEAIENLCAELQDTISIEWSYHIDDVDGAIHENKEIHFYRVIQEGVKNIIKHSSAEEASVLIKRTENTISVTIWDDGKGFDLKANGISEGLGFLGMRERIQSLGGNIDIQSVTRKGTTIKIEIPTNEYGK